MYLRILIASLCLLPALSAPALAAAGAPDPSFNGSGLLRLDRGGAGNLESAVAVQPDGKLVVAGAGPGAGVARIHRLDPDGSPDLSFGDHGLVTIDNPGADSLSAVLVQPDGKILAGGVAESAAVLYRFTTAGRPDQGFGDGGRVTLTPADSQAAEMVFGLAERDGRIVAVGQTVLTSTKAAVWARKAQDGAPDGQRALVFGTADEAAAVAIQPDGRILVAGTTNLRNDGFVTRLNTNLVPDQAFQGGTVKLDAGAAETARSLALLPDGRIVVVGRASVLTRIMVTELTSGGLLDPGFNDGAPQFLDTGLNDFVARVLVQPDGKLVIVGTTDLNTDATFFRLTTVGQPDPSFARDGLETFDAGGLDAGLDAALQPDGDIVAVGTSDSDGIVMRVLGDPLPLTVTTAGPGRGSVSSSPAGIDCGVKCAASFDPGTKVTLTAIPAPGSRFSGWTGCASATATCTVELHAATSVTASFAPITLGGGTGAGHGLPAGDTTPPRITHASLSASRFRLASRATAVAAAVRHGTSVRFTLSEPAATTLAVQRGGRTLVTLRRPHTIAGANAVSFSGRTRPAVLRPGRYRMVLAATDAAGNRSAPVTLRFTVVRR